MHRMSKYELTKSRKVRASEFRDTSVELVKKTY